MEDETLEVDTQGGCCDNDVHEIFKCMEETVLKKAFLHEAENGDLLCYSCSTDGSTLTTADKAEMLCYRVKKQWKLCIDGKQVILLPTEHPVLLKL